MNELTTMFKTVAVLRFRQLCRIPSQLGLIQLLLLLSTLILIVSAIVVLSANQPTANLIALLWSLILFSIHMGRHDKTFRKIIFRKHRMAFIFEYLLYSIPVAICLGLASKWIQVLYIIMACFGISFIEFFHRTKSKSLNNRILTAIPSYMYEWRALVRKYYFALAGLLMIGCVFSFHVACIPIVLACFGLILLELYDRNEPVFWLMASEKSAGSFLFYKVKTHCVIFFVATVPLVLLFLLLHQNHWHILAIEWLAIASAGLFQLMMKYAFITFDTNETHNPIGHMGGLLALFPPFTPIIWVFTIILSVKAINNLKLYTHASD